jgi:hypothetical protein
MNLKENTAIMSDLIKPENNKNPLKNVLLCSFILAFVYLVVFAKAISDEGFGQLLASNLTAIVGFFLIIVFVISYYGKLILAWWIAFLFFPIVWSTNTVLRGFLSHWKSLILVGAGWFVFICPYLVLRYQSYKGFIHEDIAEPDLVKPESDENPLRIVLFASFILAFFSLSTLLKTAFAKGPIVFASSKATAITELFLITVFIISYHSKMILAWWIALLFGPTVWSIHIILYGLSWGWKELLSAGALELICIWYLALRYKPYKCFIKKGIF